MARLAAVLGVALLACCGALGPAAGDEVVGLWLGEPATPQTNAYGGHGGHSGVGEAAVRAQQVLAAQFAAAVLGQCAGLQNISASSTTPSPTSTLPLETAVPLIEYCVALNADLAAFNLSLPPDMPRIEVLDVFPATPPAGLAGLILADTAGHVPCDVTLSPAWRASGSPPLYALSQPPLVTSPPANSTLRTEFMADLLPDVVPLLREYGWLAINTVVPLGSSARYAHFLRLLSASVGPEVVIENQVLFESKETAVPILMRLLMAQTRSVAVFVYFPDSPLDGDSVVQALSSSARPQNDVWIVVEHSGAVHVAPRIRGALSVQPGFKACPANLCPEPAANLAVLGATFLSWWQAATTSMERYPNSAQASGPRAPDAQLASLSSKLDTLLSSPAALASSLSQLAAVDTVALLDLSTTSLERLSANQLVANSSGLFAPPMVDLAMLVNLSAHIFLGISGNPGFVDPSVLGVLDATSRVLLSVGGGGDASVMAADVVGSTGYWAPDAVKRESMATANVNSRPPTTVWSSDRGPLRLSPLWGGSVPTLNIFEAITCPTCPACDRSVVLPVIAGVIVFLTAIAMILYCGRQRVGASLFEQTARAEYSAQVAMHEAEVKSSFLANMSHEIRTPLHAIASMGRMLMDSRQADPRADRQDLEDIGQIIKSSETLEALVNDILFISKMQTTSFELGNRAFDMCELLEDIVQLLALRYSAKNVECCSLLKVPEFSYQVFADALRLRQVLTNLATNAMKFTDEGCVIVSAELVELHPSDDYARRSTSTVPHLLFKVKDTGVGMDSVTMNSLFQRFYQSKQTMTRQAGGAGLGLAISAELVSLMGGTIGVHSPGPGLGSQLWFTLPVEYPEHLAHVAPQPDEPEPAESPTSMEMGRLSPVPGLAQETTTHVARVAYEPSGDFIQRNAFIPLPPYIKLMTQEQLKLEFAFVIFPNDGPSQVLSQYLTRWKVRHLRGHSYADVAQKAHAETDDSWRSRSASCPSIIIVDIDNERLPDKVLTRSDVRFIFVCNDSHRRKLVQSDQPEWYSKAHNKTLLNKPVKREAFWKSLVSLDQVDESYPQESVERTLKNFSLGRKEQLVPQPPPPIHITTEEDAPPRPSTRRILIAEDNLINIKIAKRFVAWAGYEAEIAMDGQQALDAVINNPQYDLILMDCQMPNLDGFAATKRIRALPGDKGTTAIVAMTAYTMPEDQARCLSEGMSDYISKPFTKEQFRDIIRKWLGEAPIEETTLGTSKA